MTSLRIALKGRKDPIYTQCDRYEVKKEGADEWLVLYRGDKESGRYRLNEILGYDEPPEPSIA